MDIFVDIDGTLTVETGGWGIETYEERTPRKDTINKINKLYEQGNIITLWTSRYEKDREVTKRWLEWEGVKYHALILGKPKFDVYVCDKVINVKDFV